MYVDINENVSYEGRGCRVSRFRKERGSRNFLIATTKISHSKFAVNVLISKCWLVNYSVEKIHSINTKTSKIITMTVNFRRISDIIWLYLIENGGNRDLNPVLMAF